MHVMLSRKTRLMEVQKQALIKRRAFCAAFDQSLIFMSHKMYEHLQKTLFSHSAQVENNLSKTYVENTNLGKHCLLLQRPDFRR